MVKRISNYYYVYEYSNYTDANGKRYTKMGKVIGSIKEGIGFIPNSSFTCDSEISEYSDAAEPLVSLYLYNYIRPDSFRPYTSRMEISFDGSTGMMSIM